MGPWESVPARRAKRRAGCGCAIVDRLPRRSAARIMLRRAQEITRYERRTAVVVSRSGIAGCGARERNGVFDQSPLRGSGLEIER